AVGDPVGRLKASFADAGGAMQQQSARTLARLRDDTQAIVTDRLSALRQIVNADLDAAAQEQRRATERVNQVLAGDAATVEEKRGAYGKLIELNQRYYDEIAADQNRLAEIARREADRLARPYRQAFDQIGAGW